MIIPYMYPGITQLKAEAGSYKLPDTVSMRAAEERNGAVDLEMRYLYSGENADEIACERLVMAVLQRNKAEEPFRIYDVETPIDGVITVHAHHLIYDLDGATLEPFTATGISNVLSAINTQLGTLGFDFLLINDGLTFAEEFGIDVPESAFSVLGKLIEATGAEVSYAWDSTNKRENVTLHASRGTVSTATIAYGFNLLRVDCSVNSDAVYSAIYPYYAKDEEGVLTLVTLPEKTISTGATTTRTRVLPVDLTSQFSDTPTQAELRQAANDYIGTVSWDAVTSCSVEFVPLQNTTEYAGNIDEQLLSLCDVVTVSADVIGVEMTSKVVKTVYDQLAEKYTEMTVGTIEQTIADTIAGLSGGSTGLSGGSGGSGGPYAAAPVPNGNAIRTNGILYGTVDNTSTATAFTATVAGLTSLYDGAAVMLRNGVVTSASGFTIDVNGLGAKPVYSNMAAATRETTIFNANYTLLFVYDSTRVEGGCWVNYRGYYSDANSIGYQLRTNSTVLKTADQSRYYRIFFTSADGTHWVPANTAKDNSATSTKTVNQRKIDPHGRIIYYGANTNFSAESDVNAAYCWDQYACALGYSFNRTGVALTLTTKTPVYVKCAPQTDGSAIIDSTTPIVQALPSTADGKIYIFLGVAYSATNIELVPNHPVYEYKDGAIRIWTNAAGGTSVSPATATPIMDGSAAVGTSAKYAREDHVHPADTSIPNAASIDSSGLITFKHDNTALFTLQLPVQGGYTVTVSLTNPINPSQFYYCNIDEQYSAADLDAGLTLGQIQSASGSTSVTVPASLYGVFIDIQGNYGSSFYSNNISVTGGVSYIGWDGMGAKFEVTGNGTITIDNVEYYDDD